MRLQDELIIEGYTYRLLRGGDIAPSDNPKIIDIDEALDGLACLTSSATTLATLKSARGKFFDNLEGSQYKSVFNPTVSGVKLINVVLHHRYIESVIKDKLSETDYQTDKKRYGILTHANRVFASVLLESVPQIKRSATLIEVDKVAILGEFETLLGKAETLVETYFPSAYLARLFSNVTKINTSLEYFKNNTPPVID